MDTDIGLPIVTAKSDHVTWLQSEKDIQAAIVTWLKLAYPKALVLEFGKPGGHKALAGAVPAGWPDLLVIIRTPLHLPVYFPFEVKTTGGRRSDGQERMVAQFNSVGQALFLVRSVAKVRDILVGAGFEPQGGL